MTARRSRPCPGRTASGAPCENTTADGGWCGKCANPGKYHDTRQRGRHLLDLYRAVTEGDRYAEWELAGVHEDDIDYLSGHGLTPEQVKDWLLCDSDYDPGAWVLWHRHHVGGMNDRQFGLFGYHLRGIRDPQIIATLVEQHITPGEAFPYTNRGIADPLAVALYANEGVPAPDAAMYYRYGFHAYDGLELFDEGISGLEAAAAAKAGITRARDVIKFMREYRAGGDR